MQVAARGSLSQLLISAYAGGVHLKRENIHPEKIFSYSAHPGPSAERRIHPRNLCPILQSAETSDERPHAGHVAHNLLPSFNLHSMPGLLELNQRLRQRHPGYSQSLSLTSVYVYRSGAFFRYMQKNSFPDLEICDNMQPRLRLRSCLFRERRSILGSRCKQLSFHKLLRRPQDCLILRAFKVVRFRESLPNTTFPEVLLWPTVRLKELHLLECAMRQQSQSSSIRVLVSDDTRVHTELLADALRRGGDGLQVTMSTSGSLGLTSRAHLQDVDVLIMSSTLDEKPGRGFEVLRGLHSSHGDVSAVMLLDSSKHEMILEAFAAGARGVFSKQDSVTTLSKCVRRVHEGQIWANSQQMRVLVQALASSNNFRAVNASGKSLLSKRELEIVRSVSQGLTNQEIADQLGLSPHTIKNCLFRLFDKLGVSNRVELLLMTMSEDRNAQSAVQYFFDNHGDLSLQDEAALVACQRAAEEGVLMAQFLLAQFYSANRTSPTDVLQSYMWYAVAIQRLSRDWKDATKAMTVDQVLQAEQMAVRWLRTKGEAPSNGTRGEAVHRRSKTGQVQPKLAVC